MINQHRGGEAQGVDLAGRVPFQKFQ